MIGAYLVDDVTQKQWNGEDEWGEPTALTSVARKAFIEYKTAQVENIDGEKVIARVRLLLAPYTIIRSDFATRVTDTIAYEDLWTFDGADHAIIAIGRPRDLTVRFTEVWLA